MLQKKRTQMRRGFNALMVLGLLFALVGVGNVSADPTKEYTFASPLFGISASPDGSLLVADAGAGVVWLRKNAGKLLQPLPGVADVDSVRTGVALAITGIGDPADPSAGGWRFYRVTHSAVEEVANLLDFETTVNPDGGEIDSNPFDVEVLNETQALVADAGGNSLLVVDYEGNVDWIATLPEEPVSTENAKRLFGCPDAPPEMAEICALQEMIPAQAVATSVAVGPDGAYYVGELKGFPGPLGESRVWRIEPGTRHAVCGVDPACTVVADGFTSIVDLVFGPDGTLYVVEYDENSFLGVELGAMGGAPVLAGGTVNACDSSTWTCTEFATGLTMPIAVAVDKKGDVYAVMENLLPTAHVMQLP